MLTSHLQCGGAGKRKGGGGGGGGKAQTVSALSLVFFSSPAVFSEIERKLQYMHGLLLSNRTHFSL
jgi:hypothetical protein